MREHLEIYAAVKGVRASLLDALVHKQIKEMDLADFEHQYAGKLSGGNRRKL